MNNKIAWGVVNKGTLNIKERFFNGMGTGNPAIFKTRHAARTYVWAWHGPQANRVMVIKVIIQEAKP